MAVRLSVIMIDSSPPTSAAQRLAEEVVGELIGLGQIDLTLVGSLDRLPESSTDRLTLGSIVGDTAVLDWRDPAEMLELLRQIEFEGDRAPHNSDPHVSAPGVDRRRIYAFDLRAFSNGTQVAAALNELKSERQTRTFTIALDPKTTSKSALRTLPVTSGSSPTIGLTVIKPPTDISAVTATGNPQLPASQPIHRNGDELDLDDLLDQLDQSDP